MADDDPDDVQRGTNSASTPAPEVDSGCNSGEGSSPVGKTGSERQQMSSSSNHSSILESMTGPLSKRLRTLHTLQQQQQTGAPSTPDTEHPTPNGHNNGGLNGGNGVEPVNGGHQLLVAGPSSQRATNGAKRPQQVTESSESAGILVTSSIIGPKECQGLCQFFDCWCQWIFLRTNQKPLKRFTSTQFGKKLDRYLLQILEKDL